MIDPYPVVRNPEKNDGSVIVFVNKEAYIFNPWEGKKGKKDQEKLEKAWKEGKALKWV